MRTENRNVEYALNYIIDYLRSIQPYVFPRAIKTNKVKHSGIVVKNKNEALGHFKDAGFIDCYINSYPFIPSAITRRRSFLHTPNFIFIDLDRKKFSSRANLDRALKMVIHKIHLYIGKRYYPTILWTGNGYHIYALLNGLIPLEYIFPFHQLISRPSLQFLRFSEKFLSNNKSDEDHILYASFNNYFIRVPYTYNAKCIFDQVDSLVKVIHFGSPVQNASSTSLLDEFLCHIEHIKVSKE